MTVRLADNGEEEMEERGRKWEMKEQMKVKNRVRGTG